MPFLYFLLAKSKWLRLSWNLKIDQKYQPHVTILIPTYNEAKNISKKLDNIYALEYPKKKLEVVVIDSASTDGTPNIVYDWAKRHPDLRVILLQENSRRGMVPALNYALSRILQDPWREIIIFTDADAFVERDALKNIVKYLADKRVGAVTASILPIIQENSSERVYRNYFNIIRIAESKFHSTPIHSGQFMAYNVRILKKLKRLPEYTGNNDSTPASIIAFMGYRAIQVEDVIVREPMRKGQHKRKIRRAQHIILHFLKTKSYAKRLGLYQRSKFNIIWTIEWWLHIVNPWLFLFGLLLLIADAIIWRSFQSLTIIIIGALLILFSKKASTWILCQLYLILGFLKCIKTTNIAWEK